MTSPDTESPAVARQPKVESFMDWFHVNSRWVAVGAIAVLAAGFVAWWVPSARAKKNMNADRQLLLAKQSFASGNAQLAESDLKKVADRFEGTSAGAEAGILLAQLKLEKGDNQGAVTYLKELTSKLKGDQGSAARSLLGDAYAQLDKPADAAVEYERAADATAMPNEKAFLLAKAGHAYMAAGKAPEAKKIWEALAAQTENQAISAEARVRLGELAAGPARS